MITTYHRNILRDEHKRELPYLLLLLTAIDININVLNIYLDSKGLYRIYITQSNDDLRIPITIDRILKQTFVYLILYLIKYDFFSYIVPLFPQFLYPTIIDPAFYNS